MPLSVTYSARGRPSWPRSSRPSRTTPTPTVTATRTNSRSATAPTRSSSTASTSASPAWSCRPTHCSSPIATPVARRCRACRGRRRHDLLPPVQRHPVRYDTDEKRTEICTSIETLAESRPDNNGWGSCNGGCGDGVEDASQGRDIVREARRVQGVFDGDGSSRGLRAASRRCCSASPGRPTATAGRSWTWSWSMTSHLSSRRLQRPTWRQSPFPRRAAGAVFASIPHSSTTSPSRCWRPERWSQPASPHSSSPATSRRCSRS
jgi:hypothetical protein